MERFTQEMQKHASGSESHRPGGNDCCFDHQERSYSWLCFEMWLLCLLPVRESDSGVFVSWCLFPSFVHWRFDSRLALTLYHHLHRDL